MPLTAQEQRCVDHARAYLGAERGGVWKIEDGPTLDDQNPSIASPEVIITNGTERAAVEVKRITGDKTWDDYKTSFRSIRRRLVPSCGGSYLIDPVEDLRYPLDRDLMHLVKKEIERVAPTLAPRERGAIRIPRSANISMYRPDGPGNIYCCHQVTGGIVRSFSPRITGAYWLADRDQWEHAFVTDEAVEYFFEAIRAACEFGATRSVSRVRWYEEWGITRLEDDGSPDEVTMLVVTEARSMLAAAMSAVDTRIVAARPKFSSVRWADLHVVVLDNVAGIVLRGEQIAEGAAATADGDVADIDLVLLVDEGNVSQVWPRGN